MTDTATQLTDQISLTDSAANRLSHMIEQEGDRDLMLRVTVNGGGCAGFTYSFSFDKTLNEDDLIFEKEGIRAVIDGVSLEYLEGSEVDYVEGIVGASFQIHIPNATSSCGCGTSFAI